MAGTAPLQVADLTKMGYKVDGEATSDSVAERLHERMVGKTVVITGVSPTGLGADAARVIALHQPRLLLLASRTPAAVAEVICTLRDRLPAHSAVAIEPVQLDLSDQASVRAAAAAILARTPVVDVLINNAGVMMLPTLETVPLPAAAAALVGFADVEKQFAINHVGHFLLTNLLAPALLAAPSACVVSVSSRGYLGSAVRALDDPAGVLSDTPAARAAYDAFGAYGQSKTANMLFAVGLAARLGGRVLAFAVDPGAINTTNLSRYVPDEVIRQLGWRLESGEFNPAAPWVTAQQAVANYLLAAYDPALHDHNGAVIANGVVDTTILPYAREPAVADQLWALSEKLVAQEFRYGSK